MKIDSVRIMLICNWPLNHLEDSEANLE